MPLPLKGSPSLHISSRRVVAASSRSVETAKQTCVCTLFRSTLALSAPKEPSVCSEHLNNVEGARLSSQGNPHKGGHQRRSQAHLTVFLSSFFSFSLVFLEFAHFLGPGILSRRVSKQKDVGVFSCVSKADLSLGPFLINLRAT